MAARFNAMREKESAGRGSDAHISEYIPAAIGENLRRLRKAHGYSLDMLAKTSGVSRAMLGQIETAKSVPTITLIWKIAGALGVPASALIELPKSCHGVVLPKSSTHSLTSSDGGFSMRAFTSPEFDLAAEFYEIRITPGHRESTRARQPGSRASLAVARGEMDFATDGNAPAHLTEGDAILFEADVEQMYFNPGSEDVVAYLVITMRRNSVNGR